MNNLALDSITSSRPHVTSSGAFPDRQRFKPAPGIRRPTSGLHPPFMHLVVTTVVPHCVGPQTRLRTTLEGYYSSAPGALAQGPGYSVPVRHHLIGPIRPTRGHIAISPHGGLYAMPSLCGSAGATRERFRAFAAHSLLACRPLRPRGVRSSTVPEQRCRHGLRRE